jgi:hypothetical protein
LWSLYIYYYELGLACVIGSLINGAIIKIGNTRSRTLSSAFSKKVPTATTVVI